MANVQNKKSTQIQLTAASEERVATYSEQGDSNDALRAGYLPAAIDARANLKANHDTRSTSELDLSKTSLNDYGSRITSVVQSRYRRTLEHLSQFMRIQVFLKLTDTQQTIKLTILVDRSKKIQDIARQIEAEYAFMNLHDSMSKTSDDPSLLINSIQVIVIFDIGKVPLKFDSSIAEVLNNGDSVETVAITLKDQHLSDVIKQRSSIVKSFVSAANLDSKGSISKWSLHAKTFALLHNLNGIQAFQEYCLQEFEIENLLFWLEVEVFRGLCRQAVPDQSVNTIDMTNASYPRLLLHARYIYYTFLAKGSSLRLNVPLELIDTVEWPLPRVEPVTGLHLPLKFSTWDDIHEHVFQYLSVFVYPRFEQSQQFAVWSTILESKFNPTSSDDGWFSLGDHYQNFQQDVDGMEKAVKEALDMSKSISTSGDLVLPVPLFSAGSRRESHISKKRTSLTNSIKSKGSDKLDPRYYGDGPRITHAQRIRRVQREKKLKKFFGDAPVQSEASIMNKTVAPEPTIKENDSYSVLGFSTEETDDTSSHDRGDDVTSKKKRADKLGDFFGTILPEEQLFEQKLVDKIVEFEDEDFADKNDLDIAVKQKLLQKKKKLKGLLGDLADDHVINQALSGIELSTPIGRVRRAGSMSSQFSTSSGTSLVSVTEKVRKGRDEKEYKRKKLNKIQQFLGEKVTGKLLDDLQMTTKSQNSVQNVAAPQGPARQFYIKRLNKLQSMFGELPPTSAITQGRVSETKSAGSIVSLLEVLGGEEVVSYLLSHESDMQDLLIMLEEFDRQEGIPIIDPIATDPTAEQPEFGGDCEDKEDQVMTAQEESKSEDLAKRVTHARQRRRIGKLTKFFGRPAGAITPELTTEDRVLEDVARHLKQLMDPVLLRQLTAAQAEKVNHKPSPLSQSIPLKGSTPNVIHEQTHDDGARSQPNTAPGVSENHNSGSFANQ